MCDPAESEAAESGAGEGGRREDVDFRAPLDEGPAFRLFVVLVAVVVFFPVTFLFVVDEPSVVDGPASVDTRGRGGLKGSLGRFGGAGRTAGIVERVSRPLVTAVRGDELCSVGSLLQVLLAG